MDQMYGWKHNDIEVACLCFIGIVVSRVVVTKAEKIRIMWTKLKLWVSLRMFLSVLR